MDRCTFFDLARDANDGVASLAFARSVGIGERSFHRWVASLPGRPIAPGVHCLDERPGSKARLRAVLDSLGPSACLARRSALWAHGLGNSPQPLEVLAPHGRRWRAAAHGVRIRRTRTLVEGDVVEVGRWPAASGARIALDLAADLDPEAQLALVIDLDFAGLASIASLRRRVEATPTAIGAKPLARTLDLLGSHRPDSIFEWRVRRDLLRVGVRAEGPREVVTPDGTFEVDLVVQGPRVAIECDGASHRTREQLARDGRKASALHLAGWMVLRVDWPSYRADPAAFAGTVLRAVSLARSG